MTRLAAAPHEIAGTQSNPRDSGQLTFRSFNDAPVNCRCKLPRDNVKNRRNWAPAKRPAPIDAPLDGRRRIRRDPSHVEFLGIFSVPWNTRGPPLRGFWDRLMEDCGILRGLAENFYAFRAFNYDSCRILRFYVKNCCSLSWSCWIMLGEMYSLQF